ncbi:MAG: small subunit ribosomal protein [Abditibacteriota bacterium]|jgi:small subunit ribosomal protein S16|nr:small subunit ribosomal protein [Abditibacteriota bacterium]
MVRMRLRRMGAKNNPTYRIVIADQNSPRDGAFIETIGHYLPTRQPAVVEINVERARLWLSRGAQPSDTVASMLRHRGIIGADGKLIKEGAATTSEATAEQSTAMPATAEVAA